MQVGQRGGQGRAAVQTAGQADDRPVDAAQQLGVLAEVVDELGDDPVGVGHLDPVLERPEPLVCHLGRGVAQADPQQVVGHQGQHVLMRSHRARQEDHAAFPGGPQVLQHLLGGLVRPRAGGRGDERRLRTHREAGRGGVEDGLGGLAVRHDGDLGWGRGVGPGGGLEDGGPPTAEVGQIAHGRRLATRGPHVERGLPDPGGVDGAGVDVDRVAEQHDATGPAVPGDRVQPGPRVQVIAQRPQAMDRPARHEVGDARAGSAQDQIAAAERAVDHGLVAVVTA